MKHIKNELEHLKYKVKFINYVLEKKIIINNKTKQSIIDKLVEFEFPKLSKNPDDDDDDHKSYNYITSIPLFSLTSEKIDELNNEYKLKEEEFNNLTNMSPLQIWKSELKELMTEYKKWYKKNNEEYLKDLEDVYTKSKKAKNTKNTKKNTNKKKINF